jgi:hypothetical protein
MTIEWQATLDKAREAGAEIERLRRIADAADQAINELCELAEEQPENPHDDLSTRLYEIAHKIELAGQKQ